MQPRHGLECRPAAGASRDASDGKVGGGGVTVCRRTSQHQQDKAPSWVQILTERCREGRGAHCLVWWCIPTPAARLASQPSCRRASTASPLPSHAATCNAVRPSDWMIGMCTIATACSDYNGSENRDVGLVLATWARQTKASKATHTFSTVAVAPRAISVRSTAT